MRTALMLLVAGATAVKFVGESRSVVITGWMFIGMGAIVGIVGVWRFLAMRARSTDRRFRPNAHVR